MSQREIFRACNAPPQIAAVSTGSARVVAAREIQLARFPDGKTSRRTHSELSFDELKTVGALGKDCQRLIEAAATQLGLSARALVKELRFAWTITDLHGVELVGTMHVAEAIQERNWIVGPTPSRARTPPVRGEGASGPQARPLNYQCFSAAASEQK